VSCSQLDAGELPTLQQLGLSAASLQRSAADPAAAGAQLKGGETQALAHLRSFLTELQQGAAGGAAAYPAGGSSGAKSADTRSSSFSCRISPWLALGCLSPREMYHQLLKQGGGAQQQGVKQGAGKPGGGCWEPGVTGLWIASGV
jgi:deoxyribodipyrimidine photolyase